MLEGLGTLKKLIQNPALTPTCPELWPLDLAIQGLASSITEPNKAQTSSIDGKSIHRNPTSYYIGTLDFGAFRFEDPNFIKSPKPLALVFSSC